MKNFKTTTETYDASNDEKRHNAEKLLQDYDYFKPEKIQGMILSKWDLFMLSKGTMAIKDYMGAKTLLACRGISEYENIKSFNRKTTKISVSND